LDGLVAFHVVEFDTGSGAFVIFAIVGTECTGKTTLCDSLAQHYCTECLPEYAREYFLVHSEKQRNYTLHDLASIASAQICRERDFLADQTTLRILDTDAVVLYVWWLEKFGHPAGWLEEYLYAIKDRHYLLTKPDVPWETDPLRESQYDRERIHTLYTQTLEEFESPYTEIEGLGWPRLNRAIEVIDSMI
jgi:nicotinamide riboside kinase